jgi:hypothetical protein
VNNITTFLQMQVDAFGRDQAKLAAFVLDHGQAFEADERTYQGRKRAAKQCFANAAMLVFKDPSLTYVEGYVETVIPILHAWARRPDGGIIDPTLRLEGVDGQPRLIRGYWGVPFATPYVRASLIRNEVYGLLGWPTQAMIELIEGKASDWKGGLTC